MSSLVPPGSRVLEIGYGDGLLSCYLSQSLGWKIYGLDVNPLSCRAAVENASSYGLSDRLQFNCDDPGRIFQYKGEYDAVFIKTVLYNSPDLEYYGKWLDWIGSVIKPGGAFINFETGRANVLTQLYRRIRRRGYTNLCLYTRAIERLYDERFKIIDRRYYAGLSQFLVPVPALYRLASRMEAAIKERNADNCFIVSIIAQETSRTV